MFTELHSFGALKKSILRKVLSDLYQLKVPFVSVFQSSLELDDVTEANTSNRQEAVHQTSFVNHFLFLKSGGARYFSASFGVSWDSPNLKSVYQLMSAEYKNRSSGVCLLICIISSRSFFAVNARIHVLPIRPRLHPLRCLDVCTVILTRLVIIVTHSE